MNHKEQYKKSLKGYIPDITLDVISEWILYYNFNLKISRERNSKYGDYRAPHSGKRHFITINHNLNKYAFLITLIHEVAHLTTWNKFKNTVKAHGSEWKTEYKKLLEPFLVTQVFPDEILNALFVFIQNPGASSCSDDELHRVLKKHDAKPVTFVEEIENNSLFLFRGRMFKKGNKIRKNFECLEISSKRIYIFSPIAEVEIPSNELNLSL